MLGVLVGCTCRVYLSVVLVLLEQLQPTQKGPQLQTTMAVVVLFTPVVVVQTKGLQPTKKGLQLQK